VDGDEVIGHQLQLRRCAEVADVLGVVGGVAAEREHRLAGGLVTGEEDDRGARGGHRRGAGDLAVEERGAALGEEAAVALLHRQRVAGELDDGVLRPE
jgi:hypothetical protein